MPQVQGQPRQFNEILSQNTNIKRAGQRDQGKTTTQHAEDHKYQSKLKKKNHLQLEWEGTFGQCKITATVTDYILTSV